MAEYNDNDFGRLIHNIRKSKKIKVDALVKGLCSIKVLYGIEAGDMLPGYLLRSALIGRLGLAPEWFDNMLTFNISLVSQPFIPLGCNIISPPDKVQYSLCSFFKAPHGTVHCFLFVVEHKLALS